MKMIISKGVQMYSLKCLDLKKIVKMTPTSFLFYVNRGWFDLKEHFDKTFSSGLYISEEKKSDYPLLTRAVLYFEVNELWLLGGLVCHWPDPARGRSCPVVHNNNINSGLWIFPRHSI